MKVKIFGLIMVVGLSLNFGAQAFETDQLTWRDREAPDSLELINAKVNEMLERAAKRTNAKVSRRASVEYVASVFRKEIYKENKISVQVMGTDLEKWMRRDLRSQGYAIVPTDRDGRSLSIYSEYRKTFSRFWEFLNPQAFNLAQKWTGDLVSPTFIANGVRFGADKLTHFFRLGYRYYMKSANGQRPEWGYSYGTETENGTIGMASIGVFSYPDLRANFDGYLFYARVIPEYYIFENGELRQKRPFNLADFISDDWDEFCNPPAYSQKLLATVRLHVAKHRDEFCAERERWLPVRGADRCILTPVGDYINLRYAPKRVDSFELDRVCDSK
jgi:hypothetical protein